MQNATGQCTPNGTLSIHGSPNASLDGTCPERSFNHPFTQTTFMFLGELMCLVTFKMMLCGICGMAQVRAPNHHTVCVCVLSYVLSCVERQSLPCRKIRFELCLNDGVTHV